MVAWSPTSISLVLRTNAFRAMKCRPFPIGSNDLSHVVGPTVALTGIRPRSARCDSSSVIQLGTTM